MIDDRMHHVDGERRVEPAVEREQSELLFHEIAERLDEGVWIATPDAERVLYVNPACGEIWGRAVDELGEDPSVFIQHQQRQRGAAVVHPAGCGAGKCRAHRGDDRTGRGFGCQCLPNRRDRSGTPH